jgi:hypothetical protein
VGHARRFCFYELCVAKENPCVEQLLGENAHGERPLNCGVIQLQMVLLLYSFVFKSTSLTR